MNIKEKILVFTLSKENDFKNIKIGSNVNYFIADLSNVEIDVINRVKDKFITFDSKISKMKGSFVIVSQFSFDDNLTIVPSLQEAYDYIEMEEMERQLNL